VRRLLDRSAHSISALGLPGNAKPRITLACRSAVWAAIEARVIRPPGQHLLPILPVRTTWVPVPRHQPSRYLIGSRTCWRVGSADPPGGAIERCLYKTYPLSLWGHHNLQAIPLGSVCPKRASSACTPPPDHVCLNPRRMLYLPIRAEDIPHKVKPETGSDSAGFRSQAGVTNTSK
jgi:hypothetical protein